MKLPQSGNPESETGQKGTRSDCFSPYEAMGTEL
jgi:hypothetical protein